jgi:glycosyltransferase involved in cell wall biosynthesis
MSISVLVLTFNEEVNIGECLDSVAWCDDVVVLDSFSSDRTTEIASAHGARIVQRTFDDYAAQRNFGLHEVRYAHPWVLMLDADERIPSSLHRELIEAVQGASEAVALFRMRRKDYLFGRWIRGSSGYPTWFGRLGRPERIRVERAYNEEYHADGQVLLLQNHLHHFPFNKGFAAWFAKHDRYSSMEAQIRIAGSDAPAPLANFFSRDVAERRRALKRLIAVLPGRPLWMFVALYLLRGGFLEGRAGFTFSVLRAWYEYMIDCKALELRRRRAQLPV